MKERGIIFTGESVRAILAGRKTQTRRRLMKPQPLLPEGPEWTNRASNFGDPSGFGGVSYSYAGGVSTFPLRSPYGGRGATLWVKEAWRTAKDLDPKSPSAIAAACTDAGYRKPWAPLAYEADGERVDWSKWGIGGQDAEVGKIRSSMFMPRWASRIDLHVASVRVERVQAITDEDAKAEGCGDRNSPMLDERAMPMSARDEFAEIWDEINGKRAPWSANPWVWVVGFEVVP